MTENAANIAMCNQALGLLGAEAIVLSGTSVNHDYCTLYFDDSRDETLANHPWNWASITAYCIENATVLLPFYDNAFTLPTDCLRVLTVDEDHDSKWKRRTSTIYTDRGDVAPSYSDDSEKYVAGQYILSDISGSDLTYLVDTTFTSSDETTDIATYCTSQNASLKIVPIEYIQQVTDVSTYPSFMRMCFVINLAIHLSSPIIQAATSQLLLNLQASLFGSKKNFGYLQIAKAIDAQEAGDEPIKTSTFVNARRLGRRAAITVGRLGPG
jgi:hypothetical protein